MKIVTVVGARPQFIKAAAVSHVLREHHVEVLVHTGQHYDANMSDIFFTELRLPEPDIHLGIGSGSHGAQTGAMLTAIEAVLIEQRPDILLVYGDTNSTLAGALAASKLHIPVAHVEAGLRSFNRVMPEEINRVVADHLATWLFAPTAEAEKNLAGEGITNGVHVVGDVMIDAVRQYAPELSREPPAVAGQALQPGTYYLCTVHRAENTDSPTRLRQIFAGLDCLEMPVVLPMHPRTRNRLARFAIEPGRNVQIIAPVGYLEMLRLQKQATCVITDSGGIQKEAYALGTPCVTLRTETEWVETINSGWNRLCSLEPEAILCAVAAMSAPPLRKRPRPPHFGDGHAAERIASILTDGDW
ncbi:MAG: UDP-N-acetylglucosamine 2-epimerase (non-hydrolyzing) [Thermomicrobiales bacterium]